MPDQSLFENSWSINLGSFADMIQTPSCALCRLASKGIMQAWPDALGPVPKETIVKLEYHSLFEGRGGSPRLEFKLHPEIGVSRGDDFHTAFDLAENPLQSYAFLPEILLLKDDESTKCSRKVVKYLGDDVDSNVPEETVVLESVMEQNLQNPMIEDLLAGLSEGERIERIKNSMEQLKILQSNGFSNKQSTYCLEQSGYGRRIDGTKSNLSIIKEWYSSCLENHGTCCEGSRIQEGLNSAEFDHSEATGEDILLVDVRKMCVVRAETDTRYLAASYVWGTSPFLRLTLASMEPMMKPGALGSAKFPLPQTLSDAIRVTHELGEAFIWIDALCIIQDDQNSILREIGRMDMIYASAALTIIYACGNDVHARLTGIEPGLRKQRQVIERIENMDFVLLAPRLTHQLESSIWHGRGWTYQEFMLSKRMLIFTDSQAYLYCALRCTSEDEYLSEIPEASRPSAEDSARLMQKNGVIQHPLNQIPERLNITRERTLWTISSKITFKLLIQQFSKRKLTCDGDVLRACSSLLKFSSKGDKETYISGIPASILEWALCWQPNPASAEAALPRRGPTSLGRGLFPTWSWAGWVGPAVFPNSSGPVDELEISDWHYFCWEQVGEVDDAGDEEYSMEEDEVTEFEGDGGEEDEVTEFEGDGEEEDDEQDGEEDGESEEGGSADDDDAISQEREQSQAGDSSSMSSSYYTGSVFSSSANSLISEPELLPYIPRQSVPDAKSHHDAHYSPVGWKYQDRDTLIRDVFPHQRRRVRRHQDRMDVLNPLIEVGILIFTARCAVLAIDLLSPITMPGNKFSHPRLQNEVSYPGLNPTSTAAYRVIIPPEEGDSSSNLLHVGTVLLERAKATELASTAQDPACVEAECVMLSKTEVHKLPKGFDEDWNCNYDHKRLTAPHPYKEPALPLLVNFMWIAWCEDEDIAQRVAIGQVHCEALDMVEVEMKQIILE